jgi:hypothetical protein
LVNDWLTERSRRLLACRPRRGLTTDRPAA